MKINENETGLYRSRGLKLMKEKGGGDSSRILGFDTPSLNVNKHVWQ